jgi:uncharacterized protein (TIGR02145 family)
MSSNENAKKSSKGDTIKGCGCLIIIFVIVSFIILAIIGGENEGEQKEAQQKGTFIDSRDGKKYRYVTIGTQTWMVQNLDYHGPDGFLGLCGGDEPKYKRKSPKYCKKYGRLYNWEEANEACPNGWHLPSDKEWQTLVDFAGGDKVAGKKLKAKNSWIAYNYTKKGSYSTCKWTEEEIDSRGRVTGVIEYDHCATDEYGFSALFTCYNSMSCQGSLFSFSLDFNYDGMTGSTFGSVWWSASEVNATKAHALGMRLEGSGVDWGDGANKTSAISVRCLQD